MIIIIVFLATICLVVTVIGIHEFGHYLAARLLGVKVKRFAIGMGRPIYIKRAKSGIEYALCWCPLGGYVTLLDERQQKVPAEQQSFAFNRQKSWKRIIILCAGVVFNLLFAIFAFTVVYLVGIDNKPAIVGSVTVPSTASKAGLKAGDEILTVANWSTPNWALMLLSGVAHIGEKVIITVKGKEGQKRVLVLSLKKWQLTGAKISPLKDLGIKAQKKVKKAVIQYQGFSALKMALYTSWQYTALNTLVLGKIITSQVSPRALAGPLAIFDVAAMYFSQGFVLFLQFLAMFSIAVAMVNLLPIPGLDGAQVLFVIIEKFRGKPLSLDVEVLIYRLGIVVLFIVFMQLLANDLRRLDTLAPKSTYQTKPN